MVVLKIVLGVALLAAGVTAAASMLAVLGRVAAPADPGRLRKVHRAAGYVFVVLLGGLAVIGGRILFVAGDGLPFRGVLHWAVGSLLVVVTLVKVLMVRFYKKFLKAAPPVGTLVVALAFLAAALSLGFVVATGGAGVFVTSPEVYSVCLPDGTVRASVDAPRAVESSLSEATGGFVSVQGAELGRRLFEMHCSPCHGAGAAGVQDLTGLFGRETLRSSGSAVSRETVTLQILDPVGRMPSFRGRLSDGEIAALVSFLETK